MHTQLMEVDEIKNKWLKFYHLLPKARIFNVSNVPCFQLVLTIIHIIIREGNRADCIPIPRPSLALCSDCIVIISMVEYETVR